MKRKLVVNDGRSERELLLVGPIVIGRDPSCHISDLDPLLSRRHAEFVPSAKGLVVRDLGSRNGILVNGVKVPEHALESGDVIQLGHLQLRYIEEELSAAHVERQADETEPHDSATMAPGSTASADAPTAPMSLMVAGPADETVAPGVRQTAASAMDATRFLSLADDETRIPQRTDDDETMAPHSSALSKALAPDEAHLFANADLVVTSTSRTGQQIFGVRPETLIGGPLADAVARSLGSLVDAKGRPTLALVATRGESDRVLKITFKAGQATEPVR